jgi:hypothetical protein
MFPFACNIFPLAPARLSVFCPCSRKTEPCDELSLGQGHARRKKYPEVVQDPSALEIAPNSSFEELLTSIAFTIPVPRQEDIGVNCLCSLITGYGSPNLLKAGPFFSVQAKSSTDPVEYRKPHEIEWIRNKKTPFLLRS